jgi:histidine ammonia-lyase
MVLLTGRDLTRDEVVRVARHDERVAIADDALAVMAAARAVVDSALADGRAVYGLTTAAGVLKRIALDGEAASAYANRMIRQHQVALGPPAPVDVVRAMLLRLANELAGGRPGARPEVAQRLVDALNDGSTPRVRSLGSVGQADLAQSADLALALFPDLPLAPGEGLALITGNPFATAWATLAIHDAEGLLTAMEAAGALSLEAVAASPSLLHPAVAATRPYRGLVLELERLRELLDGSFVWSTPSARNLQDPLTFRNLPQLLGACRDALDHVDGQLRVELNASQGNPIVVADEGVVISVANFEILPLAAALDYLRIVLAGVLTAASERIVKLLDAPWSGLPTGLTPNVETADPGLGYLGIASQAIGAEARSLAAPVSFEMASSAHAEGIEDRMTMAPLAARRLDEQVALGRQIVARELVVATQAIELRGLAPMGRGTGRVAAAVRELVPFLDAQGFVPADLDPVADLIREGRLGGSPPRS